MVKENPYRLAHDIFGIGFLTADKIAKNLGVPPDSQMRSEAGILYVLYQLTDEGHVYYPYEELIDKCKEILGVEREIIVKAFAKLAEEKRIIWEDLSDSGAELKANDKAVYLAGYHAAEVGIVRIIKALLTGDSAIRPVNADKAVEWAQKRLEIQLAENQIEGVKTAIQKKVMVLTGGPGTGKTTIIKAVLEIFRQITPKIVMGAPTGRAAKRMFEATGWEAKTIHRLLE